MPKGSNFQTPSQTASASRDSGRTAFGSSFVQRPVIRVMLLCLLIGASALHSTLKTMSFSQPDIWWKLRSGLWILQNHAVPHTALFTQQSSLPWIDVSWLFQILLAVAYQVAGLRAFALLHGVAVALLAIAFFDLAGGRRSFWTALLIAVATLSIIHEQSLGICFSIAACAYVLTLVFGVSSGRHWSIPLVFAIWASTDPSFIVGLVLLVLAFICAVLDNVLGRIVGTAAADGERVRASASICALGIAGALFTPNTFHAWTEAFAELYSKVEINRFSNMKSMMFRSPQDYAVLLLAMASWMALGCQRERSILKYIVLAFAMGLAFRFQRDAWILVLVSAGILGSAGVDVAEELNIAKRATGREMLFAALLAIAAVAIAVLGFLPRQDTELLRRSSGVLPISACDYIRRTNLPSPLFNQFEWGGYITWCAPGYPVAIDDRIGLYGNEITEQYFLAVEGKSRLETNPMFSEAQTILIPSNSALARALTTLPRLASMFRVAYRDDTAIVLVRNDR